MPMIQMQEDFAVDMVRETAVHAMRGRQTTPMKIKTKSCNANLYLPT
jgi:hypothetical protein